MQLMLSVEGKQEDHDDIELLLSKTSSPGSGLGLLQASVLWPESRKINKFVELSSYEPDSKHHDHVALLEARLVRCASASRELQGELWLEHLPSLTFLLR